GGEGRSDTAGVVQQAGQITPEGPRRALDEEAWQEVFRIQEPRECGCQAKTDPALTGDRSGGGPQAGSWRNAYQRATGGRTCSATAPIAHARSRSDCAPAASRAVFMCGPLANARSRKRKRMRTATEAKFAPASSTCSQLNRPRWAAGSYARSASCERAPKLACRTWPTTFAAL